MLYKRKKKRCVCEANKLWSVDTGKNSEGNLKFDCDKTKQLLQLFYSLPSSQHWSSSTF